MHGDLLVADLPVWMCHWTCDWRALTATMSWTSPWWLIQMDLRLQVMHLSTGLTTLMLSNVALGSVHDALVMQDELVYGVHHGHLPAAGRSPPEGHGGAGRATWTPGMLRSNTRQPGISHASQRRCGPHARVHTYLTHLWVPAGCGRR